MLLDSLPVNYDIVALTISDNVASLSHLRAPGLEFRAARRRYRVMRFENVELLATVVN
jgi:hypothetical protein